jgi:hypothetical protein
MKRKIAFYLVTVVAPTVMIFLFAFCADWKTEFETSELVLNQKAPCEYEGTFTSELSEFTKLIRIYAKGTKESSLDDIPDNIRLWVDESTPDNAKTKKWDSGATEWTGGDFDFLESTYEEKDPTKIDGEYSKWTLHVVYDSDQTGFCSDLGDKVTLYIQYQ